MSNTRTLTLSVFALAAAACGSSATSGSATTAPTTTLTPATIVIGADPFVAPLTGEVLTSGEFATTIGLADIRFEADADLTFHFQGEGALHLGLLEGDAAFNEIVIARAGAAIEVGEPNSGPIPSDLREWIDDTAFIELLDEGTIEHPGGTAPWYDMTASTTPGTSICHLGDVCVTFFKLQPDGWVRHLTDQRFRIIDLRSTGTGLMMFVNATDDRFPVLAERALELAITVQAAGA